MLILVGYGPSHGEYLRETSRHLGAALKQRLLFGLSHAKGNCEVRAEVVFISFVALILACIRRPVGNEAHMVG